MVESEGTGGYAGHSFNFREWLEHYERDRDLHNRNISQLTKDVAALTSTVSQLAENQRSLFRRHDRPFQWGAFVSAIVGAGVFAGLLIAPINSELSKQHQYDEDMIEYRIEDAAAMGALQERTRWLEKLESRVSAHLVHECESCLRID